MERSKSFEDRIVWQKAHQLTLPIYKLTRDFPKHELYGLTSQIRRVAASVPSNLAEGYSRLHTKDKLKFFNYAYSSLEETRYQLILARDPDYADISEASTLAIEVSKLLNAYTSAISRNQRNS